LFVQSSFDSVFALAVEPDKISAAKVSAASPTARGQQSINSFNWAAICDPDPRARERARNSRLSVFADLAEALDRVRPDIVSLCTPPDVRMNAVDTVVSRAAGVKAVVIEKPLALSGSEARAIYETCARHKIEVFVAHQLRFCVEFVALKETLASGRLGELHEIHAACFGVLFDQGSHLVDQILWLTGDCPTSVDATACDDLAVLAAVRPLPAGYQRDTRHSGSASTSAVLKFRSGVLGVLTCGVLDAAPVPALGPWLQKRITLVGTCGVAHAHVASHFREVSAAGQAPRVVEKNQASYEDSLASFYDAVTNVLAGARASFQTPEENIHVVDVLEAALESGRQHRPLAIGRQAETTAASAIEPVPTRERPRVSIIMPLEDHRGMGIRAVKSWTAGQRCDPRLFELIVVIDANTEYLEAAIRALLRPGDRLVTYTAANEMEQYHRGAQLANGDILFFTEPHCLAEPDNISETIRFLKDTHFDGFCGQTTPLCHNRIARMESRMYDRGFAEWAKPGNWVKVILRAFAIRKTVYFASGGYQYRFDRFSEWLRLRPCIVRDGCSAMRLGLASNTYIQTTFPCWRDSFASSPTANVFSALRPKSLNYAPPISAPHWNGRRFDRPETGGGQRSRVFTAFFAA
jgi:predicted dehydrogenase